MVFADKMHDIIKVLEMDGLILFPGDSVLEIGCSLKSAKAIERILKINQEYSELPPVIITSSIEMTKKYVHRIHPRIETLLYYHQKPLTIIYPKTKNLHHSINPADQGVAIRVSYDPFCTTIIDLLGQPLLSTSFYQNKQYVDRIEDLQNKVIREADYVCKHPGALQKEYFPSIFASYNQEGDLIFMEN